MQEYANKLFEYITVAGMWVFAISLLLMAVFGGEVSVKIKGIWGLFK